MSYDPTKDLLFVAQEISEQSGIAVGELLRLAKKRNFINESYFEGIQALQGGDTEGNSRDYFRSCYKVSILFGYLFLIFFVVPYCISSGSNMLYDQVVRDVLRSSASPTMAEMVTNLFVGLGFYNELLKDYLDINENFFNNLNFNLGFGGFFLLCTIIHFYFTPNYTIMTQSRPEAANIFETAAIALQHAQDQLPPGSTLVRNQFQRTLNNLTGNRPPPRSRSQSRARQQVPVLQLQNQPATRGRRNSRANLQGGDDSIISDSKQYILLDTESTSLTDNEMILIKDCMNQITQNIFKLVGYDANSNTFGLATIDIQQLNGGSNLSGGVNISGGVNMSGGAISASNLATALIFLILSTALQFVSIFLGSEQEVTPVALATILQQRDILVGATNATIRFDSAQNKLYLTTPTKEEAFMIMYDKLSLDKLVQSIDKKEIFDLTDFLLSTISAQTNNTLAKFIENAGTTRQGIGFNLVNMDDLKSDAVYTVVKSLENNRELQIVTEKSALQASQLPQIISSLVNVTYDGIVEEEAVQSLQRLKNMIENLPLVYASSPIDLEFVQTLLEKYKKEVDVQFKFSEVINPQTGLPLTELSILSTTPSRKTINFIYAPFGILRIDENIEKLFADLTFRSQRDVVVELQNVITTGVQYEYKKTKLAKQTGMKANEILRYAAQKTNSFLSASIAGGANYVLTQNIVSSAAIGYTAFQTNEVYNSFLTTLQNYGLSVSGLLTPLGFTYALRFLLGQSSTIQNLRYNWRFLFVVSVLFSQVQYIRIVELPRLRQNPAAIANLRTTLGNAVNYTNLFSSMPSLFVVPQETTNLTTISTTSTENETLVDVFPDTSFIRYNTTADKFEIEIPEYESINLLTLSSEEINNFQLQPTSTTVRQFSIDELAKYMYESYDVQQLRNMIVKLQQKINKIKSLQNRTSNVSLEYQQLQNDLNFQEKIMDATVTAYTQKRAALNIPLELNAPVESLPPSEEPVPLPSPLPTTIATYITTPLPALPSEEESESKNEKQCVIM